MKPSDLAALIDDNMETRIVRAIQTGAQWEIWLQIELSDALLNTYGVMGREINIYTGSVDIGFVQNYEHYYIELKVESAHHANQFAGKSLKTAIDTDVQKLQSLNRTGHKWVCCVAWSPKGKESLSLYGFNYIKFGNYIDVGIIIV